MLVVHLHAETVRGLRNLGNRETGLGRQRRAVDDQDAALKHLARRLLGVVRALEVLVDELWSPAHDLADVGDAEHRQFAQNLLARNFGPLGAGSEDFFDTAGLGRSTRGTDTLLQCRPKRVAAAFPKSAPRPQYPSYPSLR